MGSQILSNSVTNNIHQFINSNSTNITMIFRPVFLFLFVAIFAYYTQGARVCSDGSAPTCADGSEPVRDMNRGTPPCPSQGRGRAGKPSTCPDGNPPTKQRKNGRRGGRRGGAKCPKSDRICCDGSTPNFARDGNTPQCSNGRKAKCNQSQCQ